MAEILRPIARPESLLRVDTIRNLLILAGPVRAEEVRISIAVGVDDAQIVGARRREDEACPAPASAVVQIDFYLTGCLRLVHRRADHIQPAIVIEVGDLERA